MGLGKVFGVVMLVYGVACIIFDYVGFVFSTIPNLGVFGSWLFNPLGMAFSNIITSNLVGGNPILGLGSSGIAWAVGGVLAFFWISIMLFFGSKLVRR